MGKTEKIVVLSVLFTIVVLFVWSLDQGESRAATDPGPRRGAGASDSRAEPATARAKGPAPSATQPGPVGPVAGPSAGPVVEPRPHRIQPPSEPASASGDLSARDTSSSESAEGALLVAELGGGQPPASNGPGVILRAEWDLVSLVGLQGTVDPETFVAVARTADTWDTLAVRYYGDAGRARLLRRANEGTDLRAGTELLVPAVDRLPRTPDVREIEVLEGEGLWHVAKRALGSGARWKELHDANLDRIQNPDQVRAGMLLRIP